MGLNKPSSQVSALIGKIGELFQPFLAPQTGLEPVTLRLTAECSTD